MKAPPLVSPAHALDAALAGLLIIERPEAAAITADWFASATWRRPGRALVRHRDDGGRLGNLLVAGRVLEEAGIDFPKTRAAEAVMVMAESVPLGVMRAGRERRPQLQLSRLAQFLEVAAHAEASALPRVVDLAHRALEEVHP